MAWLNYYLHSKLKRLKNRCLNGVQQQTENGAFNSGHSFPRIYHVTIKQYFLER